MKIDNIPNIKVIADAYCRYEKQAIYHPYQFDSSTCCRTILFVVKCLLNEEVTNDTILEDLLRLISTGSIVKPEVPKCDECGHLITDSRCCSNDEELNM